MKTIKTTITTHKTEDVEIKVSFPLCLIDKSIDRVMIITEREGQLYPYSCINIALDKSFYLTERLNEAELAAKLKDERNTQLSKDEATDICMKAFKGAMASLLVATSVKEEEVAL